MKNRFLTATYHPRYTPVSEYINPNEAEGRRPAHEFFGFDVDSGKIMPSELLDEVEWSIARRTIDDIDLNDERSGREAYEPGHLWYQRQYQAYLLTEALGTLEDFNSKVWMIREFTLPGKPFSSFVSAYLTDRFPELDQLL